MDQAGDGGFLDDFGAFFAGVVEHHEVELGADDLPGLGDGVFVVAGVEVEGLGAAAVGLHEGDAVFFDEVGGAHFGQHAEALEGVESEGDEGFADVIAGEFFAFDDEDAVAVFGEDGGGAGSGGTGTDDEGVVVHGIKGSGVVEQ